MVQSPPLLERALHRLHLGGVAKELDPTDGVAVAKAYAEPGIPMICLETAQPAKFPDTIVEALGHAPSVPAGFQELSQRPQRFCRMPRDLAMLKSYIRSHAPAR